MVTLRPSIQGTFCSLEDEFDPTRHTLKMNAAVARPLAACIRRAPVKHMKTFPAPHLQFTFNACDGKCGILYPGEAAVIIGKYLRCAPRGEDEGVFLETESGQMLKCPILLTSLRELIYTVPSEVPLYTPATLHLKMRVTPSLEVAPLVTSLPVTIAKREARGVRSEA